MLKPGAYLAGGRRADNSATPSLCVPVVLVALGARQEEKGGQGGETPLHLLQ